MVRWARMICLKYDVDRSSSFQIEGGKVWDRREGVIRKQQRKDRLAIHFENLNRSTTFNCLNIAE